ncbi:MAG TPA: aminopeptidase [Gemmatimonadaceae bacterium]|nr:aminopeptidase [Gemmatimonadaceae bacterium]
MSEPAVRVDRPVGERPPRARQSARRVVRIAARVAGALLLLLLLFLLLAPTGRYLVRAAWEEGKILARRREIADIVSDSASSAATRRKLEIVLAARAFASDSIQLRARQSFTTFSRLEHDTLVLVLSAAYRDRLQSYTWWFPIVGRVPYKGFFDFGAARTAAHTLDRQGFDVYLRPSPAFSTLGWFNDPLVSTSLNADSIDLANTVIHELTHNTFYAPGQAVFNESFANFVGARGSAWFFRSLNQPEAADEADARWSDDKVMARFWERLYHSIDSAYKAHRGEDSAQVRARIAARDTVYHQARTELVEVLGPQLHTIGPRVLERMRLDNAALMARRIYLTDLDLFDAVWLREGQDLRKTIKRVIDLAKSKSKDPFGALREWIAKTPAPPA